MFASSSSVYGGAEIIPTPESAPLRPRSPYAVSKLAAEWYVRVFAELFPLETVALRYFNVFGPRQRPDSTYAAVIPLFTDALLRNETADRARRRRPEPRLHVCGRRGGRQPRRRARSADICSSHVYNVAPGTTNTLLDLLDILGELTGNRPEAAFVEPRAGDVRRSQADASAARSDLGWTPDWTFEAGLREVVAWMRRRANGDPRSGRRLTYL